MTWTQSCQHSRRSQLWSVKLHVSGSNVFGTLRHSYCCHLVQKSDLPQQPFSPTHLLKLCWTHLAAPSEPWPTPRSAPCQRTETWTSWPAHETARPSSARRTRPWRYGELLWVIRSGPTQSIRQNAGLHPPSGRSSDSCAPEDTPLSRRSQLLRGRRGSPMVAEQPICAARGRSSPVLPHRRRCPGRIGGIPATCSAMLVMWRAEPKRLSDWTKANTDSQSGARVLAWSDAGGFVQSKQKSRCLTKVWAVY